MNSKKFILLFSLGLLVFLALHILSSFQHDQWDREKFQNPEQYEILQAELTELKVLRAMYQYQYKGIMYEDSLPTYLFYDPSFYDYEKVQDDLIGFKFPVALMKGEKHEVIALHTPYDFDRFGMDFPDSLRRNFNKYNRPFFIWY